MEHGVEWRSTRCGSPHRRSEPAQSGSDKTITRWRGWFAQSACGYSEGIRPLPIRRNPKRRFRPTRALGLVLRRGRHPLCDRDVGQERLDLRRPHVVGVSLIVMQHEASAPIHVGLLRPDAVVLPPIRSHTWSSSRGCPSPIPIFEGVLASWL